MVFFKTILPEAFKEFVCPTRYGIGAFPKLKLWIPSTGNFSG